MAFSDVDGSKFIISCKNGLALFNSHLLREVNEVETSSSTSITTVDGASVGSAPKDRLNAERKKHNENKMDPIMIQLEVKKMILS